jgi:hypothetical protein
MQDLAGKVVIVTGASRGTRFGRRRRIGHANRARRRTLC